MPVLRSRSTVKTGGPPVELKKAGPTHEEIVPEIRPKFVISHLLRLNSFDLVINFYPVVSPTRMNRW